MTKQDVYLLILILAVVVGVAILGHYQALDAKNSPTPSLYETQQAYNHAEGR
jgi:hypothetical protein